MLHRAVQFVENMRILILQVPSQLLYRTTHLLAEWTAGIDQRLKIRNQPGQIQFLDRLTERAEPDLRKQRIVLLGVSNRNGRPPRSPCRPYRQIGGIAVTARGVVATTAVSPSSLSRGQDPRPP
jgi:hypothetical protein